MLTPVLRNARRSPRVPFHAPAEVTVDGETWQTELVDLGPGGCLLTSPRPLGPGAHLRLVVRSEEADEPLNMSARVVWAGGARVRLAFAGRYLSSGPDPQVWFRRVTAARPGLTDAASSTPAELPVQAPIYFRAAPRTLPALTADEALLVRRAENGASARELLARCGLGAERGQRALWALFDKRVFTLALGQASDPWRWRAGAAQAEAEPLLHIDRARRLEPTATPSLLRGAPSAPPTLVRAPPTSAAPVRGAPAQPPSLVRRVQPPGLVGAAPPKRAQPELSPSEHAVLLRGRSGGRRPERAQALYDAGLLAADEGRVSEAVALFRQALSLAPRDAEISKALGGVAFRGR